MKDKHQKRDENEQTLFYYEAIGFLLIIFTVVIVAELGTLGYFLTIFFKVLFGDWYLLFVLILFILGVSNILNHQKFNYRNQRFVGYVICVIGLLMLAHFPVHNYVINNNNKVSNLEYFSLSFTHYKNYVFNHTDSVLGGGIIGGLLFFLVYFLLGRFGVILISLIILSLGITMILDKSIKEIFIGIGNRLRGLKDFNKRFNDYFKYEIGKKEKKRKEEEILKKLSLKNFLPINSELMINYPELEHDAFKTKNIIKDVLDEQKIDYKENEYNLTYGFSLFTYIIYSSLDCKKIGDELSNLINDEIYLYRNNNNLMIEINNQSIYHFSIYDILLKQDVLMNNYLIPIGIDVYDELVEIDVSVDGSFLITGDKKMGIKNFIAYYIYSIYLKNDSYEFEFYLYDRNKEFHEYNKLFKNIYTSNITDFLVMIQNHIDSRYMLFRTKKVKNINEYNYSFDSIEEREKNYLKKLNYIIYTDNLGTDIEDKIIYFLQTTKDVGINIIYITRDIRKYSTIFISTFEKRIVFGLNDAKMSKQIIDSYYASSLKEPGEAILYRNGIKKRIMTPLVLFNNK